MSGMFPLTHGIIAAGGLGGGGSDFDPSDYGTVIWDMDPANGVEEAPGDPCEDGDAILNWLDQSSTGAHYQQTTAANKPIYKTGILNGKPVVRGDGVDDYLSAVGNDLGAFTGIMLLYVMAPGALGVPSDCGLHEYVSVTDSRQFRLWYQRISPGGAWEVEVGFRLHPSGWQNLGWQDASLANPHVITAAVEQSGNFKVWMNNVLKGSSAFSTFGVTGGTSVIVKDISASGKFFLGDIGRIVAISPVPSEANRSAATSVAMNYYGVS